MKAMILAAGLGTRLKPFTNEHPKALAEVNGKPLLRRNIEYLKSYGIRDIIINIHHFPQQIVDFVKEHHSFDINISFSDETDEVLETGGGLKRAGWFLRDSDPFILMNVDILTDMNLNDMIDRHREKQAVVTLAVSERATSRYFLFDDENRLCGWENVKTGERRMSVEDAVVHPMAFSGVQILSPRIFDLIRFDGKFSVVDVYLDIAAGNKIYGFDHSGCRFIDVGKPESVILAEGMFE